MSAFSAELLKLKRSLAWPIVVLLPVVVALAGAATRLADGRPPTDGWHTVWLQSVGFYGLFPLALGIAILGSLVWRPEHRGGNWNALMSGPTSSLRIVAAKTAVVAGLTALMQLVLLAAVLVIGAVGFGLPGLLPREYLLVIALLVVATIPVAAAQSAVSMCLRASAAPVAARSSVGRTDSPSATMRCANCSWASGSSTINSARACPAESTPAATRRCTSAGSRSNRMVLEICGRERLIRWANSSWVQPNSTNIC